MKERKDLNFSVLGLLPIADMDIERVPRCIWSWRIGINDLGNLMIFSDSKYYGRRE